MTEPNDTVTSVELEERDEDNLGDFVGEEVEDGWLVRGTE